MSIRFLTSELSPKVKAYNLIEENILRQKINSFDREKQHSLRMIDKELKKFEDEQHERDEFWNKPNFFYSHHHPSPTSSQPPPPLEEHKTNIDELKTLRSRRSVNAVNTSASRSSRSLKQYNMSRRKHPEPSSANCINTFEGNHHKLKIPKLTHFESDSDDQRAACKQRSSSKLIKQEKHENGRNSFLPTLKFSQTEPTSTTTKLFENRMRIGSNQKTRSMENLTLPRISKAPLTSLPSLPNIHFHEGRTRPSRKM